MALTPSETFDTIDCDFRPAIVTQVEALIDKMLGNKMYVKSQMRTTSAGHAITVEGKGKLTPEDAQELSRRYREKGWTDVRIAFANKFIDAAKCTWSTTFIYTAPVNPPPASR
jgi:hypothetical protein